MSATPLSEELAAQREWAYIRPEPENATLLREIVNMSGKDKNMPEQPSNDNPRRRLGVGGWLTIVVLGGLLGAAVWYSLYAMGMMAEVSVGTNGKIAMALGIVFSVAVGAGLMSLMFYSHRKGFDQ